ncbi:MAG: aryl-sulfate sulfotransferase [Pseudomonadota bacterium]
MPAALLLLALLRPAAALSVVSATCTVSADNLLRYDCEVELDSPGLAWIAFGEGSVRDRRTVLARARRTHHQFTLVNLAQGTTFTWQVLAWTPRGRARGTVGTFTTSDLADLDGDGVDDADFAFTVTPTATGTSELDQLLINYGCGVGTDHLVILDAAGRVVWYQDLRHDSSSTPVVTALGWADRHPMAIVDDEWLLEYSLEGELLRQSCFCDASGLCPDGSAPATSCLPTYVHHEIVRQHGLTWVLAAEALTPETDVYDCDGDGDTTDTYTRIVDGVLGLDDDFLVQQEWWLDEAFPDPTCPYYEDHGRGYWTRHLTGSDWSHANSIWLDDDGRWTLSLRHLDSVIQVQAEEGDPDYAVGELLWVLDGTGLGGDFTLRSSIGASPLDFSMQHHAWWTDDGTMRLYDNQVPGTNARVLDLALDPASGDADIVASWDLGDSCPAQGSAYALETGGHLLALCPEGLFVSEYDPASTSEVLRLDLACDGTPRGGPVYRAIPVSLP